MSINTLRHTIKIHFLNGNFSPFATHILKHSKGILIKFCFDFYLLPYDNKLIIINFFLSLLTFLFIHLLLYILLIHWVVIIPMPVFTSGLINYYRCWTENKNLYVQVFPMQRKNSSNSLWSIFSSNTHLSKCDDIH